MFAHGSFFPCVAFVNLEFLESDKMSLDIDCPGDTVTYNCSIESNTETLHLTWSVKFPVVLPIQITYDTYFGDIFGKIDSLDMNVTASLLDFRDGYIESIITLTVLNADTNGTIVECSITDLDYDMVTVLVNTSGTYVLSIILIYMV